MRRWSESASCGATTSRNSSGTPFFPVNTLLIMRGAIAAQLDGVFERYVDEMFRHMWAEPKKMDDPEVVRAALEESGFNAASLMARTQEPEVKDRLLAEHASVCRARHVRRPDLLRRRRNLLRQGSAARRRGRDRSRQCLGRVAALSSPVRRGDGVEERAGNAAAPAAGSSSATAFAVGQSRRTARRAGGSERGVMEFVAADDAFRFGRARRPRASRAVR